MVAQFAAALARPVSHVRIENYRNGGTDQNMIVNYFYNLELSESLYPSLQSFEVSFRNSLHVALSHHFGSPFWFDTPNLFPQPNPPSKSTWQTQTIRKARKRLTEANKLHDPDRIVAELNLGFWAALLNKPLEQSLWRPNGGALIQEVFPGIPRRQRHRQAVWDRVDHIRLLRNRVMHYEPVWNRPHLRDDHAIILETLHWISPEMHRTIALCDRFLDVLDHGRDRMERRIEAEILHWHSATEPGI